MSTILFLLEEPSAQEMLKGILPKLIPDTISVRYIVFEGKQDLEKKLGGKLRGWQIADTKFIVLRDQDSGECKEIKKRLLDKCVSAGKPTALVRIACHELESFYLGDLRAVERGMDIRLPKTVSQDSKKFRDPDYLSNPSTELRILTKDKYQKIGGSRAIAPHLAVDISNRSKSFSALINGIRRLLEVA